MESISRSYAAFRVLQRVSDETCGCVVNVPLL